MLARARRQPIIKWEESDVIQIHAHLARYRLARYECDKVHLDKLAEKLSLLRDFHFNTLVHPPLRAKIKREFDRLVKEKHVTGDDYEWGPHTRRWAEPDWAGDRNGRGRRDNGAGIGDEGAEQQTPSSELGPDDSDAAGRSSLAFLSPRADGLGQPEGSIMSACNRVLRRDISSLGEMTEDHFNALHLNRGRPNIRPYHLERTSANRSVSGIDLSRLVLSAVNNNNNNNNNSKTTQINSLTNRHITDRVPLERGALLSPPQESFFQNIRQSSPQAHSQVSAANSGWSHVRRDTLSHLAHRRRREGQPLGPHLQQPLHRPSISHPLRDPRRALVEQLLSRQKGLLTDMIALAAGIRFTKYQIESHKRFNRFRPYKAESLGKILCVARHRLGSSLAKVMAIEDTLTRAEPALRAPAGMNGLLHVIFALSCELTVGR
ncbi:hypothetical protein LY78DRAFT_686734 [Colletotrichum sublineola]|nr:hypothetical protein LY78DRAFT_686734 [Colletotrichum sublineola]